MGALSLTLRVNNNGAEYYIRNSGIGSGHNAFNDIDDSAKSAAPGANRRRQPTASRANATGTGVDRTGGAI